MAAAVLHAMPGDLSETVRGEFPPVATRPRGRARAARRIRRLRYWLRPVAQDLSSAKGIVRCGRRRTFAPGGQGTVEIRLNSETGAAYFAGLLRCGSVWECPVCMHRIQYERAKELRAVLAANRDRQGAAYMLTLTLPHDQGDDHRAMRRHVARAWRYVQTGAPWRRLTRRLALVGSCRALETTHGPHGWHPHLHVLLVLRAGLDAEVQRELLALVRRRWTDAITRPNPDGGKQYRPPSLEHGVTLTVSHEDDYLAKLGLADELAGAAVKGAAPRLPGRVVGRRRGVSPVLRRAPGPAGPHLNRVNFCRSPRTRRRPLMTPSCACPYCGAVECCRQGHPDSVCQQPQGQVVGL